MKIGTTDKNLSEILYRPLIIGASVSADYLSSSPGKQLAQQFTEAHHIRTVAHNGASGRETINRLTANDWKERSIVIGVDLFFWDSIQGSLQASLNAMEKLVRKVQDMKIPLVLGEIPELIPSLQPSRKALNDEIHRICQEHRDFFLVPLDRLVKQILNDGYIEYRNRKYNFWELVPDGLHIGEVAGSFLAETMKEIIVSPGTMKLTAI
jgi:hypothetical protein